MSPPGHRPSKPMKNSRTTRLVGFIVFALVVQFVSWQSRIDVLEDFTVFSQPALLELLLAASVLWYVLDLALAAVRRPIVRYAVFDLVIFVVFLSAIAYGRWRTGDGLVVGPMGFVLAEWAVTVGLYGIVVWAVVPAIARGFARKHRDGPGCSVSHQPRN